MQETVEIEFDEKEYDTGLATLFLIDEKKVWIPNSVIEVIDEDIKIVEVKVWWAEKEGLV